MPVASRILLGVLLLISVLLMTFYAREGDDGPLHSLQVGAQSAAAPIGSIGAATSSAFTSVGTTVTDVTADGDTLSALREQNEQLRVLAAQNEEYRQEAERLQELLNLTSRYAITGVTGRIIGRSTDAWNQTITLDVGSDSGVASGLTVMAASGVIGQVIAVTPTTCQVRLLRDPQSGAAVLLQSSRAEGVVRGSLDGLLYLENISADTDVQPGDVVLTSGLGGSYVPGLLVGTVARVEGAPGDASRRILVTPNTTAQAMEEATVVFDAATSVQSATVNETDAKKNAATSDGDSAEGSGATDTSGATGDGGGGA